MKKKVFILQSFCQKLGIEQSLYAHRIGFKIFVLLVQTGAYVFQLVIHFVNGSSGCLGPSGSFW